ncbi:MAG: methyltransferase [Hyphomonadaceae bacterium]|nr:MAG: methyltransferase [Hyphomonadaceae bacterium]
MTNSETKICAPGGDYWPTPMAAVLPLLPFLPPRTRFFEPCAGNGALIDHLVANGHKRYWACDIAPKRGDIITHDAIEYATSLQKIGCLDEVDFIITNPPYSESAMLRLLDCLPNFKPSWFLLQAGFVHNKYFAPLKPFLKSVASVGRIKWVEGSRHKSTKDYVWVYDFEVVT